MKPTPLVEVEWQDAYSDDSWQSAKKARKSGPMWCRTVGYLLREDDDAIVLADTICETERDVAGTWYIPKGMVRKVRKI